jgi:autotransporter-associated beta strand protein
LLVTGGQLSAGAKNRDLTLSLGGDALIDIDSGGTIRNGGWQAINWASNLADLNVDGTLEVWDGATVKVDALTGSGTITKEAANAGVILEVGVNNGSGTFSGTIGEGIGANGIVIELTKSGTGIQTLSGANTYTGSTIVGDGTLAVTGSLGATVVSVNNGTLAGNGDFGTNVTIAAGAILSLDVASTPAGQDTSAITGTLAMDVSTLNLTAASTPADGIYVLATATVDITGVPQLINYNGINGTVSLDTVSTPKRLLLTVSSASPEPATITVEGVNVDGDIVFSWDTTDGQSYNVLTNADLTTTNWGVSTSIVGDGNPVSVTNIPVGPQLFYKVISE